MNVRWLIPFCLTAFCALACGQLISSKNLSTQDQIHQTHLDQHLGAVIPATASFIDDQGRNVQLGNYLGHTPTLLVLGYFSCPDLCPMTFRHLTEELNGIAPVAGKDFQIVVISFDPRDTTKLAFDQKVNCVRAYKWPNQAEGWHFLTGQDEAIQSVARAVGFHYAFDQKQQKFIHPTGVMVLTPAGQLSHYFFGIDASPADMESAIHDAAAGRITAVDQPEQQYCVDYDPTLTGRGRQISHIVNTGCIAWAGILFAYIGYKIVGDVHRRKTDSARPEQEVES